MPARPAVEPLPGFSPVIVEPTLPVFARHESFHPRFGWLKKAFDAAQADPSAFLHDDAQVELGVGKNMVKAIRYWANAFKILDDAHAEGARGHIAVPSDFGRALFDGAGWDPYLENPGSLWLLHWTLLRPPCLATAWDYVFSGFRRSQFSTEELLADLAEYLKHKHPTARYAPSSLKKDIQCVLRMYVRTAPDSNVLEDSIDSPFCDLDLIAQTTERNRYQFRIGPKSDLSSEIVGYAALSYAQEQSSGERTISLSRLMFDPGSPGQVFKLTESALLGALEDVAPSVDGMDLVDSAGVVMMAFPANPADAASRLLSSYYGVAA